MKIDVNYQSESDTVEVTFHKSEFKTDQDSHLALNIVFTFAHNFDLEPEMEVETIQEILSMLEEENKDKFTFGFNEDGVEVDLAK